MSTEQAPFTVNTNEHFYSEKQLNELFEGMTKRTNDLQNATCPICDHKGLDTVSFSESYCPNCKTFLNL